MSRPRRVARDRVRARSHGQVYQDAPEPTSQAFRTAELRAALKPPQERLLYKILCELSVAREREAKAVERRGVAPHEGLELLALEALVSGAFRISARQAVEEA